MSHGTAVALVTLSTLSLITSTATLVMLIVGGVKIQKDMAELRTRTNRAFGKFKSAITDLEF